MGAIISIITQIITAFIGAAAFYFFIRFYESHQKPIKSIFKKFIVNINEGGFMLGLKKITGVVLMLVAIVILVLSYNAYMAGYHKTISTSNFTFLFSGIFWDLVGILIGAVLIAIGLILAYPKGARWIALRGK